MTKARSGRLHPLMAKAIGISLAILFGGLSCSQSAQKKDDFFTSGNREADQRADQRMAKDEQLKDAKGTGIATAAKADANQSLYDRLGSDPGIAEIVDDFIPRVMADPRVNWARAGVTRGGWSFHRDELVGWNATYEHVQGLKKHLSQFIALATGGPSLYEGKEMQAAHAGYHISNAEFDAAVGDLKASLDKLGVPVKEQKELLSIIESTRPEIVEER